MQIPWSTSLESWWPAGKLVRKWIGTFQSISFSTWNLHMCMLHCMPQHAPYFRELCLGGFFSDGGHSDSLGGFSRSLRWILWHHLDYKQYTSLIIHHCQVNYTSFYSTLTSDTSGFSVDELRWNRYRWCALTCAMVNPRGQVRTALAAPVILEARHRFFTQMNGQMAAGNTVCTSMY